MRAFAPLSWVAFEYGVLSSSFVYSNAHRPPEGSFMVVDADVPGLARPGPLRLISRSRALALVAVAPRSLTASGPTFGLLAIRRTPHTGLARCRWLRFRVTELATSLIRRSIVNWPIATDRWKRPLRLSSPLSVPMAHLAYWTAVIGSLLPVFAATWPSPLSSVEGLLLPHE